MASVRIEPLERKHRSLLKEFRNQHASLVECVQRFALRHVEKDLLARTFLAIHADERHERLAGYFTLTTVSIDRSLVESIEALSKLPRFPIPGILLARLAVDERVQGEGLGRYLFEESLGLTLQLARTGPIVFRLFVTDAIDEAAARFYERFGLVRLSQRFPARMVLDLEPMLASH